MIFWALSALLGATPLRADGPAIQLGSTVAFHYVLTIDREIVDRSLDRQPMRYVQGMGHIIPGLEEQMLGLKPGDKRHVIVPPAKAYGHIDSDAYQTVPKKSLRGVKSLKIGTVVNGQIKNQNIRATVISIDGDKVTLNLNHPLAGKTLEFDVEIISVQGP